LGGKHWSVPAESGAALFGEGDGALIKILGVRHALVVVEAAFARPSMVADIVRGFDQQAVVRVNCLRCHNDGSAHDLVSL